MWQATAYAKALHDQQADGMRNLSLKPHRSGMFGSRNAMSSGLVATPEQRAETERLTAMLFPNGGGGRVPDAPFDLPDIRRPRVDMPMQTFLDEPAPQPRQGGGLRHAAGIFSDFLSGMAGGPALYAQQRREDGLLNQRMKQQQMLADMEARQPVIREVGGSIVSIDPSTGQSRVLHQAPQEAPRPTSLQQNYEFLRNINPQLAEQYLAGQANPMQYITTDNGDGTRTIMPVPRGGAVGNPSAAPQPGAVIPDPRRQGGAPSTAARPFQR